jgi:hypothetical protein
MGGYVDVEAVHLDAEQNFLARSRPSCTDGTVKGASQLKILLCAKTLYGAASSAGWRLEGVRCFYG